VALCQGDDRAILTYMGSLNAIMPEDVTDEFLASAKHLHHGSFFLHTNLRSHIPAIFHRAYALGLTTSLDTNWDPDEIWNSTLPATLKLTDIFFPNDQEACSISRTGSVEEAIQVFQDTGITTTVIKLGAAGAIAAVQDKRYTCVLSAATGGDSIGAGDSFDAGFLAGRLRGLSPEQCLLIASHCGREVASQTGGLRGQPDWKKVLRLAQIQA